MKKKEESPKKKRSRRPSTSPEAASLAAAIMEVLSGELSPSQAAKSLGISSPRYYTLEARAVSGLIEACEPRPMGRVVSASKRIERLEQDNKRLRSECMRLNALLRVSEKAAGISRSDDKPQKGRRAGPRARRVVNMLRKTVSQAEAQPEKATD